MKLYKKLDVVQVEDVFMDMLDNEEMWYFWADGNAVIISDASLMDC